VERPPLRHASGCYRYNLSVIALGDNSTVAASAETAPSAFEVPTVAAVVLDSMGAPHEPPNSLNNRDAANVQLPEDDYDLSVS